MNKYVKVKRVLAAILTVIILIGVCDWSTFVVYADVDPFPDSTRFELKEGGIFGKVDSDWDDPDLFKNPYSLSLFDSTNPEQIILDFLSALCTDHWDYGFIREWLETRFRAYGDVDLNDYLKFIRPNADGTKFVMYVSSFAEHYSYYCSHRTLHLLQSP